MKYIVHGVDGKGLQPHKVQSTKSINSARTIIFALGKPSE